MEIHLHPEQLRLVEQLLATGRYSSVDEVVSEGIRLLSSTEEIRSKVKLGVDQADRGELVDHDAVFTELRTLAAAFNDDP